MIITPKRAEELVRQRQESPDLDYKEKFDNSTGAWTELAKDVYGMANYGGGYIVIGVKDGTFEPVGVEDSFDIDSQVWASKLSKWSDEKPDITYFEHFSEVGGKMKKFPILYIHGSVSSLIIPKTDVSYETNRNKKKIALRQGAIYTRNNTETITASGSEIPKLSFAVLKRTGEKLGSTATSLEIIPLLNKKAKPDQIEETLWSNLFPVTELPDYIYTADTKYRSPKEIYSSIKNQPGRIGHYDIPAFIMTNKKICSFKEFDEDNPLSICVGTIHEPIHVSKWLSNKEKQHDLVMLLNYNLKDLCWKRGFQYDRRRKRYFVKYSEPIREVAWKPYKKKSTRKLINIHTNKMGKLLYYEHVGAKMRFTILGSGVYLVIEPTPALTYDGKLLLDQSLNTKIRTRNNSRYHNNNYLYDMKFLLHLLAGTNRELHLGPQSNIVVLITPLLSQVSFGITSDRKTDSGFLDELQPEPLEYEIIYEESKDDVPLQKHSRRIEK